MPSIFVEDENGKRIFIGKKRDQDEKGQFSKKPSTQALSLHDGITMMDEKSKKPRCKASAADFLVVRYIHRVFISSYFSVVEIFMTS